MPPEIRVRMNCVMAFHTVSKAYTSTGFPLVACTNTSSMRGDIISLVFNGGIQSSFNASITIFNSNEAELQILDASFFINISMAVNIDFATDSSHHSHICLHFGHVIVYISASTSPDTNDIAQQDSGLDALYTELQQVRLVNTRGSPSFPPEASPPALSDNDIAATSRGALRQSLDSLVHYCHNNEFSCAAIANLEEPSQPLSTLLNNCAASLSGISYRIPTLDDRFQLEKTREDIRQVLQRMAAIPRNSSELQEAIVNLATLTDKAREIASHV